MNANELRLGNFINIISEIDNKKELKVKVWSIYENLINGVEPEKFKEIPLTEEWLIKLGLQEVASSEDRNRDFYKMFEIEKTNKLISLNFYLKTNYCAFNFDIGYGNNTIDLYFVHQLQNLYFALTGQELVVFDAVS